MRKPSRRAAGLTTRSAVMRTVVRVHLKALSSRLPAISVEVFAVAGEGRAFGDGELTGDTALDVDLQQCATERFKRLANIDRRRPQAPCRRRQRRDVADI